MAGCNLTDRELKQRLAAIVEGNAMFRILNTMSELCQERADDESRNRPMRLYWEKMKRQIDNVGTSWSSVSDLA